MKGERWLSALEGALLAFCIAFGGCGCMVSGFEMKVSMTPVALCCGACAVVLSVCFVFRQWIPALCALALAGGYLWQSGKGSRGMEALLNKLTQFYDMAYGCGSIQWSGNALTAGDLTVGICLVGGVVTLILCMVVCRRGRAWFGLLAALAPLAACLVVTDTVPETAYLLLLLLGVLLLLLTQTTRRKSAIQGARLLGMLALPAALALVLLFWAVPQEGYQAQPREEGTLEAIQTWAQGIVEQAKDGTDILPINVNEMDLRLIGPKSRSQRQVMEVTAAKDGPLYLRGQAFGTYDGQSWAIPQRDWGGDTTENWGVNTERIGEITITTNSVQNVIYLPYNPGSLERYGGMALGRVENKEGLTSYTVIQNETGTETTSDSELPYLNGGDEARYLTLPEDTRQAAEDYLRRNLGALTEVGETETELAQARAIVALVKGSAAYDLDTQRMPVGTQDFAMWFLEESDTGYCVHFATAATVLLRAAGIPARYVTGYLVDGAAGEPVAVREENAHAWVEIFLHNVGWIMLEPTPSAGEEQNGREDSPAQTPDGQMPQLEEQEKLSEDTNNNAANPETERETAGTEQRPSKSGWFWGMMALVWLGGLAAAVIVQWRLRLYLRRWAQQRGDPNAQALARWREATLLSRLLNERPDKALFELAQKAKYSQHTLEREELAQFDTSLEAARNTLRKKPLPLRLIDRLIFAAY